jgi:hypothetical protein
MVQQNRAIQSGKMLMLGAHNTAESTTPQKKTENRPYLLEAYPGCFYKVIPRPLALLSTGQF